MGGTSPSIALKSAKDQRTFHVEGWEQAAGLRGGVLATLQIIPAVGVMPIEIP